MPLPALLPGIGPVMGLDEALSWAARGRPSYDVGLMENASGELFIHDPDGNGIVSSPGGTDQTSAEILLAAGRDLCHAFQNGELRSYVAPEGSEPLTVPRLYWRNGSLGSIYRGTTQSDVGAGLPVLISRREFDAWREAREQIPAEEKAWPSHEELVDWCKAYIRDGRGIGGELAFNVCKAEYDDRVTRDDYFRTAWNEAKTKSN
jgi:hypothetical protein